MENSLNLNTSLSNTTGNSSTLDRPRNYGFHADITKYISGALLFCFILLIAVNYLLTKIKSVRKKHPKLTNILQPTLILSTIGIIMGLILKATNGDNLILTLKKGFEETFLIILLPPILFEGALTTKMKPFYRNIGTIIIFAFIGTILSTIFMSALMFGLSSFNLIENWTFGQSLAFGALYSATDPVAVISVFKQLNADPDMNAIVFGESIFNDAVGLIIFKTVLASLYTDPKELRVYYSLIPAKFVGLLFGSVIVGLIAAIIASLILKRETPSRESSRSRTEETENSKGFSQLGVMFVIPWAIYLVAEFSELSGIVALMSCGFIMARYSMPNLSIASKTSVLSVYKGISHNFDIIIFVYMGLAFSGFENHFSNISVVEIILLFLVVQVCRFLSVEFSGNFSNLFRNKNKILRLEKTVLWFSGFRGAMAFAMSIEAYYFFENSITGQKILSLTILFNLMYIYFFGFFISNIIHYYDENKVQEHINERKERKGITSLFKKVFRDFEKNVIRKALIKEEQYILGFNSFVLDNNIRMSMDTNPQRGRNLYSPSLQSRLNN